MLVFSFVEMKPSMLLTTLFLVTVFKIIHGRSPGYSLDDQLIEAAKTGNIFMISYFLNRGANVNCPTEAGTPLMIAAGNNQLDAVRMFLRRGAIIDAQNALGQTALAMAAKNNHCEIALELLKAGANVNSGMGTYALIKAAEANATDMVDLLLRAGAFPDQVDEVGATALNYAAGHGNTEMVALLLGYGANPDFRGPKGTTPLMYAAGYNHYETARYLILQGANPNLVNDDGNSPLMFATFPPQSSYRMVKELLENRVYADRINHHRISPLMMAAFKGDCDTVKLLLHYGANPHLVSNTRETALQMASRRRNWEVIDILLKYVETTTTSTSTTTSTTTTTERPTTTPRMCCKVPYISNGLITTSKNIHLDIRNEVEAGDFVLLACLPGFVVVGSSVMQCQRNGTWLGLFGSCAQVTTQSMPPFIFTTTQIPLRKTTQVRNDRRLIPTFPPKPPVTSPSPDFSTSANLFESYETGREAVGLSTSLPTLLDDEFLNFQTRKACDSLIQAARTNSLEMVKSLVEESPENVPKCSNLDSADIDGWTALMWASNWGYAEVAEFLLSRGANPNAANNGQSTPLIFAAKNGHYRVVELLLNCGADPNWKNIFGTSPVSFAASAGYVNVMTLLLDHRADVDSTDTTHQTPLMWAVKSQNKAAVQTIINRGADLNIRDRIGNTALMYAARGGYDMIATMLLCANADRDIKDNDSLTAVMWALATGNESTAKVIQNFDYTANAIPVSSNETVSILNI